MKNHRRLLTLVFSILLLSCNETPKPKKSAGSSQILKTVEDKDSRVGEPEFPVSSLTKDFMSYWTYHSRYVKLFNDFAGQDEQGQTISKLNFLQTLAKGGYIPVLLHSNNDGLHYSLYKLPAKDPKGISAVVAAYAAKEVSYFKMEGKPFPAFDFKDLNGNAYTSENTKGKILLFKCWFITCHACVQEIPFLNEMKAQYRDRKDMEFISLAIDDAKPLRKFLTHTKFDYETVSNQEKFMTDVLAISSYPTHFLVDKNGILVKVVDEAADLAPLLKKQAAL